MKALNNIFDRAANAPKHIVLAEGVEPRIIQAAADANAKGIAKITILGDKKLIIKQANELQVSLENINIIDPATADNIANYTQEYYQLRKTKGMTLDNAHTAMLDPLYYAQMMVNLGDADGSVNG
jgi:phosphate acetyltransferase